MDKEVKAILKSLEKMNAQLTKLWADHEKWLRVHEVRLNEHWKHISK